MKKINLLSGILLSLLVITVLSLSAVAAGDRLLISGFEEEIEVSVEEIKGLPVVEKTVLSVNSSGDEYEFTITGGLFSDLLENYGKSQGELKAVRLVAGDGYGIELDENVLQNREIILGYLYDGEEVEERYGPIRVVIPEERAMYWVKNLVEIEVIDYVETVKSTGLYFLETIIPELEQLDYTYYESVDKAIKISELIEMVGLSSSDHSVKMVAVDDFEKSEDKEIFDSAYLKITGNNAPLFISPDIPKGMQVKNLSFIGYGEKVISSVEKSLEMFEPIEVEGNMGIEVEELLEKSGLLAADTYIFEAIDGYSVELAASDLKGGIVYLDEKGRVRSHFPDLPKNTSVKYLYSIEAVL
ncbi:MAG TPA: molybdopterin-dependent oxidoreductase [Halanaerobiales bacterium]|nr:molybdopterin-dependent oxidoreductase [Halanaerobiales bacterium]